MSGDDADARLAQAVKIGLPAAAVVGTGVAYATGGIGPSILAAAGGMFATVIVTVWASLRSLGEFDEEQLAGEWEHSRVESGADETKLALLRTLKDLEHERDVGKLSGEDYVALSTKYRSQLKAVMTEMDRVTAPHIAAAERMAASFLDSRKGRKNAVGGSSSGSVRKETEEPKKTREAGQSVSPPKADRRPCSKCSESNEPDATFCKKCGQKLLTDSGEDATA